MRTPGVLVLDFDGVICDSWRECALVTWAGQHDWTPAEFGVSAFQAIPAAFIERFRALRGNARHLGHFLVPVLASSEQIRCQHDFDRYYASLAPNVVAEFVQRASRFRASVRNAHRTQWLAFHELYEGVPELLSALRNRLYIVTARDGESVRELLAAHGIAVEPERIYGEQHSKGAALFDIQAREHAEVYFVDDNLDNVMAAQTDGHRAAWALWGYSAPEHRVKADWLAVPVLSLPDLPNAALAVIGAQAQRRTDPQLPAREDDTMRVAMLMADGFEESEFRHPYDALRSAGHEVVVVGPHADTVLTGKKGKEPTPVDIPLGSVDPESFDAVVIPGGYSPDRLRIIPEAVAFVAAVHAAGRPIAAICHGPWLLIEAGVVRGRTLTGWASVRTDVRNAGGIWTDAPVVTDGLLITSRAPADLPHFSEAVLESLARRPAPGAHRMASDHRSATVLSEREWCRE